MVKHLLAMQETRVRSLSWEDPLEKEMATHPVFLPGKFHGRRSLEGYSPWGRKESDTTETSLSFFLSSFYAVLGYSKEHGRLGPCPHETYKLVIELHA